MLWVVGVKNADEGELRTIASDPEDIHMYNVNDFSFLLDIVDELTDNLCNSVKGPGTVIHILRPVSSHIYDHTPTIWTPHCHPAYY